MIQRPALALATILLLAASCGDSSDVDAGGDGDAPAAPASSLPDSTGDDGSDVDADDITETTVKTPSSSTPDASEPDTSEPETSEPSESSDQSGSPAVGAGPIDAGLQPFVDSAVADLADSQAVGVSEITVESAQIVQWPDSSAGCPKPGMQYAQVITDGSAIRLIIGDASFWYHTGGENAKPSLCTSASRQSPPGN